MSHRVKENGSARYDRTDFSVVVGAHNLHARESSQKRHKIRRIVTHANYSALTHQYDIALLQLKTSIKFNAQTGPICVDNSTFPPNTTCVVTGWGITSYPSSMYATLYSLSCPKQCHRVKVKVT